MCLNCRTDKPVKTEKDITVYKVLLRVDNTEGVGYDYVAPYVNSGACYTYHKGVNLPKGMKDITYFHDMIPPIVLIGGGFLHAFTTKEAAELKSYTLNSQKMSKYYEYVIFEMKIPAGSEVYYGNDNDICSTCLIWED